MGINNIKAEFDSQEYKLSKKNDDTYSSQIVAPNILNTTEYNVDITAIDTIGNIIKAQSSVLISSIWIPPKLDWSCRYDTDKNYIGDYFEIEDWRRIMGNLIHLKELAYKMYPVFIFAEMVGIREYDDFPFASEWNDIENNIVSLTENTFYLEQYTKKMYYDELPTPNYADLNRIESTSLKLYEILKGQYDGIRRLSITLGGDEFGN